MRRFTLTAGCKVNLGLRITGCRADGYHTLDSIFWPLSTPHDTLHIEWDDDTAKNTDAVVVCPQGDIDPVSNTLTRAYAAFAAATGSAPRLHITLHKGIALGAGLGGGSSDAAVLLRWLNTHAPQPLPQETLHTLALTVGADVPFFLYAVPARVQGIGDSITPLTAVDIPAYLHGTYMVLLCPPVHISTPWAYAAWDVAHKKNFMHHLTFPKSNDKECTSSLSQYSPLWFVNDFEDVVFAAHPTLAALKQELGAYGAKASVMSGSGASLLGLFASKSAAHAAAGHFEARDIRAYVTDLHAGVSPSR